MRKFMSATLRPSNARNFNASCTKYVDRICIRCHAEMCIEFEPLHSIRLVGTESRLDTATFLFDLNIDFLYLLMVMNNSFE